VILEGKLLKFFLLALHFVFQDKTEFMIPKGKLLIIGGHEEKGDPEERLTVSRRRKGYESFEILGALINKAAGTKGVIEIITAASNVPDEMEEWYTDAYKNKGFTGIGFIHGKNKTWDDNIYLKRIDRAHAVFFTGGDQVKLVAELKNTALVKAIWKKYTEDPNFILAGTSAGAMSVGETIIEEGLIGEVLLTNDLKLGKGFSFIGNVIVDTHFIQRGRFARLAQAVIQHPECLGIGLSENTALLISGENEAECMGSGMTILIDGTELGMNNGKHPGKDTAIVAQNLKVHILADGCKYFLKDRKFELMK
jgi:cyanophycinase